jgi:hypothetical protein
VAAFWLAPTGPATTCSFAILHYDVWVRPKLMRAYHDSEHGLIARFDLPVEMDGELYDDDALNPANWAVVRSDGKAIPDLLGIEVVDTTTVRLCFAAAEVRQYEAATVTASEFIAALGGGAYVQTSSASYYGAAPKLMPMQAAVETVAGLEDLACDLVTGHLSIMEHGDYALSPSVETLRKLIFRALTTAAGEWAHEPGFGAGVKNKSLGGPARLQAAASACKAEILALPLVRDALVTVEDRGGGEVVFGAVVQTKLGTITDAFGVTGNG